MKALILAIVLALAISAAALAMEPHQQREIVNAHNRWRAAVGVLDLVWSERLAAQAEGWANRLKERNACAPEHNPDNARKRTGENIFWASPVTWSDGRKEPQKVTPAAVVDDWGGESRDYNYTDNTCAGGKLCGHYTQIVWQGTREVGCGSAICRDGAQVWVCNYAPPGNIVGRRPY